MYSLTWEQYGKDYTFGKCFLVFVLKNVVENKICSDHQSILAVSSVACLSKRWTSRWANYLLWQKREKLAKILTNCTVSRKNTTNDTKILATRNVTEGDSRLIKWEIAAYKLVYRKGSTRWVLLLLTKYQKTNHLAGCDKLLARYRTEVDDFSKHSVICDEMWVHHYNPETKQAAWNGENLTKQHHRKPRSVFLLGKFLQRIFGITEAYCATILFSPWTASSYCCVILPTTWWSENGSSTKKARHWECDSVPW